MNEQKPGLMGVATIGSIDALRTSAVRVPHNRPVGNKGVLNMETIRSGGHFMNRMNSMAIAHGKKAQFYMPPKVSHDNVAGFNKADSLLCKLYAPLSFIGLAAQATRKGESKKVRELLRQAALACADLATDTHTENLTDGMLVSNVELIKGKLVLIATELVESGTEAEKPDTDLFADEVVDIILRSINLLAPLVDDVDDRMEKKMRANLQREPKHGKITNI